MSVPVSPSAPAPTEEDSSQEELVKAKAELRALRRERDVYKERLDQAEASTLSAADAMSVEGARAAGLEMEKASLTKRVEELGRIVTALEQGKNQDLSLIHI